MLRIVGMITMMIMMMMVIIVIMAAINIIYDVTSISIVDNVSVITKWGLLPAELTCSRKYSLLCVMLLCVTLYLFYCVYCYFMLLCLYILLCVLLLCVTVYIFYLIWTNKKTNKPLKPLHEQSSVLLPGSVTSFCFISQLDLMHGTVCCKEEIKIWNCCKVGLML